MSNQGIVSAKRASYPSDFDSPSQLIEDSFYKDVSEITPGKETAGFALCAQDGGFDIVLTSSPEQKQAQNSISSDTGSVS